MTEEEAKTKWCPFVRQSATFSSEDGRPGFGFSYNRSAASWPGNCNCIGSACMAWQWIGDGSLIVAIKKHRADTGSSLIEAKEYVESRPDLWASKNGFCGLAGKP